MQANGQRKRHNFLGRANESINLNFVTITYYTLTLTERLSVFAAVTTSQCFMSLCHVHNLSSYHSLRKVWWHSDLIPGGEVQLQILPFLWSWSDGRPEHQITEVLFCLFEVPWHLSRWGHVALCSAQATPTHTHTPTLSGWHDKLGNSDKEATV